MVKQRQTVISGKRGLPCALCSGKKDEECSAQRTGGLIRIKELPRHLSSNYPLCLPAHRREESLRLQVLLLLGANSFPFLTKDINFLTLSPQTFHEPTLLISKASTTYFTSSMYQFYACHQNMIFIISNVHQDGCLQQFLLFLGPHSTLGTFIKFFSGSPEDHQPGHRHSVV